MRCFNRTYEDKVDRKSFRSTNLVTRGRRC